MRATGLEATVAWRSRAEWETAGHDPILPALGSVVAAGVRGAIDPERSTRLARSVIRARADWASDFDGEQFTLGRAFYTHLEQGRSREYFVRAAEADAVVERWLPGMQGELRYLLERMTGGHVRPRRGFCGPGVHVFPPGRPVAKHGGVVHADLEGLTAHQIARGAAALTLVVGLRPAARGGALRIWDAMHDTTEEVAERDVPAPYVDADYGAGDALLFDSRRVHQIRPFAGRAPRITATVHAVAVDAGQWEAWF